MKKIGSIVVGALVGVVQVSSSFAGQPYSNSHYLSEKTLPYEHCKITDENGHSPVASGTVGALLSITPFYDTAFILNCWIDNSSINYSIPVFFDHIFRAGLNAGVVRLNTFSFKVTNLNEKRVSDLTGTFRGIGASLTPVVGGGVGIMSHNGIRIKYADSSAFVGADLGSYASLKVQVGKDTLYDHESGETLNVPDLLNFRFVKIR